MPSLAFKPARNAWGTNEPALAVQQPIPLVASPPTGAKPKPRTPSVTPVQLSDQQGGSVGAPWYQNAQLRGAAAGVAGYLLARGARMSVAKSVGAGLVATLAVSVKFARS